MTITLKEKEELRVAIAEEMGWDFKPSAAKDWKSCDRWCKSPSGEMLFNHNILPYTTSIDAIREAAMERFKTKDEKVSFQLALVDQIRGTWNFTWQLAALDWCMAFARIAKIWWWKV